MRVLTITNWYPPHHYGGYELSCFDVMTGLEERGHDIAVLCSDQRLESATEPTAHEANVHRPLRIYHTGEELFVPPIRERLAIERHNQRQLTEMLDSFEPDVVSVWHLAAMSHGLVETVAERGLPIVYAVCDEWLNFGVELDQWAKLFEHGSLRRLLGRTLRPLVGVPTVVGDLGAHGPALDVSEDLRSRTRTRTRYRFTHEPVVYSGIETGLFEPPAVTEAERPWSWRILATGRFDPRKGFETVLRALAELPAEATLSIYGRGGEAERHRLEALASDLGLADRLTMGTLERHEMAEAYRAADVYVFPSEWDEPFGLVPIEAMACGTPVVATGVGGSKEFLTDEQNCLLFPAGDPSTLAERIRSLHDSPDLRRRLIDGGLATAEVMDVDNLVDVMEQWHLWAADGGNGPVPVQRSVRPD